MQLMQPFKSWDLNLHPNLDTRTRHPMAET